MKQKVIKYEDGFSMTELMVALVIIGVLVLLALPRLMPVVNKAKATEAKLNLKQVYMLEKAYKFEFDKFSDKLVDIGFEQETLITEGGTARYKVEIESAELSKFSAIATAIVDFDDNGTFNVWEVNEKGIVKERVSD